MQIFKNNILNVMLNNYHIMIMINGDEIFEIKKFRLKYSIAKIVCSHLIMHYKKFSS